MTPIDEPDTSSSKLDLTPIDEETSLEPEPINKTPKKDDSLRDLLSEDAKQVDRMDKPGLPGALSELGEAAERYPQGIMKTAENLQTGQGSLNPLENIYTPTPDKRDATAIAQDIGDRVLPEAKINNPDDQLEYFTTLGTEFIKKLPFTMAGVASETTNPTNLLLAGGIAKTPHVEIPAPKWVDDAITGFIKNFHAPLTNFTEKAKTKLTNSITDEIYNKIEPRMDELKQNFKEVYGREATNEDIKNSIRSKLDEKGLQEKNLLEQGLMLAKVKLQEPLTPVVEAPKQIGTEKVSDVTERPSLATNPIVEAEKHGKVVGIDAETKLPIIDRSKSPVVTPKTETPQAESDQPKLDLTPIEEGDTNGQKVQEGETKQEELLKKDDVIRLEGQGPRLFTIMEEMPAIDGDLPDETFYNVKDNKTGEETVIEESQIKKISKPSTENNTEPSQRMIDGKLHELKDGEWVNIDKSVEEPKSKNITVYQGRGKTRDEIYEHTQYPVAGKGSYYADTEGNAKRYGKKITTHDIDTSKLLSINNDEEWQALTKAAGNKSSHPIGMKPEDSIRWSENIKKEVLKQGYSGLHISVPESKIDGKTLKNVFSHNQVVAYKDISSKTPSTKIPEFKKTQEALAFGEANKNNPQVIKELDRLDKESTAKLKKIINKTNKTMKDLQDTADESTRGQLYREALEAARGVVKPGYKKTPMAAPPVAKPNKADPKQFARKLEQLNRFAQGQSILRKGARLRSAAGLFLPIPKRGEVKINQETLKDDSVYMAVLAHELGHAVEFNVVGKNNDPRLKMFGDNLTKKEIKDLYEELRNVTREIAPGGLEGKMGIGDKYGAGYYNRPTELIARFFEKMLVSPGNLEEVAPTAVQLLEKQAVKHPIIAEFIEAAKGGIDKGELKHIPFRDLRETFQKYLGKRAGQRAYGDMVAHKAMVERGKIVIENFLNEKFKNVKDDPETLFRSAESIKISRNGVPEFGTRRYSTARSLEDEARFLALGMKKMPMPVDEDGMTYPQYAQDIYTPQQGKDYFEALSPEGKKLILDFTAARNEAKDFFNREMIRESYGIQANLEGWVHHYFEDKPGSATIGGDKLKFKKAGARKQRTGAEGYVEDFKKAMKKALVDLESEREFNIFMKKFFARVTKPLADGAKPDQGWVEVEGSLKAGVGTKGERNVTIVQDGKSFKPRYTKYQMPKAIYERYKLLKGLTEEASDAMKVVNDINRYWRINILAHPATAATNFVSGGVQYSAKILNDFYRELLTGNISMPKTKKNVSALFKVLSPKGWNSAPDWIYGGDLSNFYGEFMGKPTIISGAVDAYADKTLKLFSFMERYWKKVISLSEDARTLEGLNKMTPEGLKLPTDMERDLLAQIEQATDIYAYNYDNIPLALEQWRKNVGLNAVKPFLIYPYKNLKQVYGMISKAFDRTLPWQDRVASLMALTMIVAMYAYLSQKRKEVQQTPEATVDIPARLQTRGRLFMHTDEKGREMFVRVSKYPFLNLSEAGMQFVNGHWEDGNEIVSNMLGSVGPVGQLGLLAMNFRNKYQVYTPTPVIIGDSLASFMPLGRILGDISRYYDPYQRNPEEFSQSFTKMIPTTDELLQEKLHGKIRTERVPVENGLKSVEGQNEIYTQQGRRTTIDVPLENYKDDILLAMLTGVYVSRIDPEIVEAFITRKEKNIEKKARKEGKGLDLKLEK